MKFINKKDINLKVDLHMHSTDSDGSITLEELMKEIIEKDIKVFSITEHDTTQNILKVSNFAQANKLHYISGVEVTATLEGRRHILGYGIDSKNVKLNQLLAKNRILLYSGKEVNNLIFASPKEVVDAILGAGGVPILAHPGASFYDSDYKRIVRLMLEKGVMGIECYHPENSNEITNYCLEICSRNNLFITGGSDYHGDCVISRKLGIPDIRLDDINLKNLI